MKPDERKATDLQVGGAHYKDMTIQPAEYCQKNGLGFCESCVVKYVSRHRYKNGVEDIDKAIHFLKLLKQFEYPDGTSDLAIDNSNPVQPTNLEEGASTKSLLKSMHRDVSTAMQIGKDYKDFDKEVLVAMGRTVGAIQKELTTLATNLRIEIEHISRENASNYE